MLYQSSEWYNIQRMQSSQASHKNTFKETYPEGALEGLAKGLSNAISYGIDSRKTLYQLHGFVPKLPRKQLVARWTSGLASSCSLIGLIYFSYYNVYNRMLLTQFAPCAGQVSALVISGMKLPIYNGMRVMQSAKANSIASGCMTMYKASSPCSVKNVYKGYGFSLLEDMIEMDLRTRLYNKFRNAKKTLPFNASIGTLASATAAAVTTPFDNVRLHMCVGNKSTKPLHVCMDLLRERGVRGLYKGVAMRVTSNVVKNSSFFVIFELLKEHLRPKPKYADADA